MASHRNSPLSFEVIVFCGTVREFLPYVIVSHSVTRSDCWLIVPVTDLCNNKVAYFVLGAIEIFTFSTNLRIPMKKYFCLEAFK